MKRITQRGIVVDLYCVGIPQTSVACLSSRMAGTVRWFVDYQGSNVGCAGNERDAMKLAERVEVVDGQWFIPPTLSIVHDDQAEYWTGKGWLVIGEEDQPAVATFATEAEATACTVHGVVENGICESSTTKKGTQ